MPPIWLHCNLCYERKAQSWHISSCGKIVCQNCLQQLRMTHCGDCRGPCTRTIELNSRAPRDVQRLFGDISEEIKAVSKIIDFQDKQKAKFLLSLKNNNVMLDKKRSDMAKVKERKLAEIEEARTRLSSLKKQVKKKKAILSRSNHIDAENQPPGKQGHFENLCSEDFFRTGGAFPSAPDSLLSPQSEGGQRFYTSTPAHVMNQTGNLSLNSDFMQLKTPAAWHRQEGKRQKRAEVKEVRKSLDMSWEDDRSPAIRALDKLLGKYILTPFSIIHPIYDL